MPRLHAFMLSYMLSELKSGGESREDTQTSDMGEEQAACFI